jgi:hypothetical protein
LSYESRDEGESVYEQPSLHLELAKLKHRDYEIEARRARLAAQADRKSFQGLDVVRSAVASVRDALSRRRPAPVPKTHLQPI